MALTPNIKRTLAAGALSISLAFGAAAPAIAQDASANENIQQTSLQSQIQIASVEEARAASANSIVLHFGNDISANDIEVISGGLKLAGYHAKVYSGGPANHVALCVNEKCGRNPMTIDQAHGFLLVMLDRLVPEYKFASNQTDAPTPEAG